MIYTDLVFDLFGTLVDIHTEETELVWEKTALYCGYYGAHYTGQELHDAFYEELKKRQIKAGQSYECFPDIPFESIIEELLRRAGVMGDPKALALNAAHLFRISTTEYIRLYPGVLEALARLRQKGFRLWLLSNAQSAFTSYELQHLGLGEQLDGIYISSDYGCRKPDARFYQALLKQEKLDSKKCLMIGNDRDTDIAGAKAQGMATFYMHTLLTPAEQAPADPALLPGVHTGCHYEYEGDNWFELVELIEKAAG